MSTIANLLYNLQLAAEFGLEIPQLRGPRLLDLVPRCPLRFREGVRTDDPVAVVIKEEHPQLLPLRLPPDLENPLPQRLAALGVVDRGAVLGQLDPQDPQQPPLRRLVVGAQGGDEIEHWAPPPIVQDRQHVPTPAGDPDELNVNSLVNECQELSFVHLAHRLTLRSRLRYWIASAMWGECTASLPPRSAMVRATLSTRSSARAERPRRSKA